MFYGPEVELHGREEARNEDKSPEPLILFFMASSVDPQVHGNSVSAEAYATPIKCVSPGEALARVRGPPRA